MNATFANLSTWDTLILILLPSIIVAGTVFFLYARKLASSHALNRKEEMRILAMKIIFNYTAEDKDGIAERLAHEKALFSGKKGTAENIISGAKNGISVALFDYTFHDLQKESITVCMLTLPSQVSTFSLVPLSDAEINDGKAAQLGDKLLGDKYRIECPDKAFAQKAFNESLIEFLSRRRRTAVLGHGNIIVFHRDKILGVRTCYSLLDFAFGLYMKMDLEDTSTSEIHSASEKSDSLNIKADLYVD